MNSPAGKPRPTRRPAAKTPVQLNLRRTPVWPEEDELNERPDGQFWKWFGIVFLCHIVAFIVLILLFNHRSKPPQEFISLLPPGDVVKGTTGPQAAPKIANTTPAPSRQAEPTPPRPVTPPKPKVVQKVVPPMPKPTPILAEKAPVQATPPVVKPKPRPIKPKVKVDLTLADAPADDTPAPPKPVKPSKVKSKKSHKSDISADTEADSQGLSKQQVAQKLGDDFHDQGVPQGLAAGANGDRHGHKNDFSDFYQAIHDQVMSKWTVPNVVDESATDPIVQIHVEKDGRVPADLVRLVHPSGNPAYDQSALTAARGMRYTLQPLPEGCPPDISIDFNLRP